MTVYWIIIIISLLLMSIRYCNYNVDIYIRYVIITLVVAVLFYLYVFRSLTVGKDYLQYYSWYNLYDLSGIKGSGIELGYSYLSSFARAVGYFRIIPIFTFLIILLSVFCIKKSVGHINGFTLLSFFILLGLFTTMFNPIRESIAFGFISFGISFILINMNLSHYSVFSYRSILICIIYLFFILLAYGFHRTAVFGVIFIFFPLLRYKITKTKVIVIGLLMIYLSFTGIMNKLFTRFISLDHDYTLKYRHTSLNTTSHLLFSQTLVKVGPLIVQLLFLYVFISRYENLNNSKLTFILWGYLFYLFMFTAPGSNIARRLQMYTYIFPLIYSCLFMDGLFVKHKKYDKITNLTKFMFVSFWVLFYISKLYVNSSGIIPYLFA